MLLSVQRERGDIVHRTRSDLDISRRYNRLRAHQPKACRPAELRPVVREEDRIALRALPSAFDLTFVDAELPTSGAAEFPPL